MPDPERETAPDSKHAADEDKTTAERPARSSQTRPSLPPSDELPTLKPVNRGDPAELATPLATFAVERLPDMLETDPMRAAPDLAAAMARPPKTVDAALPRRTVGSPTPAAQPMPARSAEPSRC